ncbi:MAG TPA: hypothetical protein VNL74_05310 [Methylococcus sp.]|nr:hypothetical protein [Methylococcus sp.]
MNDGFLFLIAGAWLFCMGIVVGLCLAAILELWCRDQQQLADRDEHEDGV